MARVVGLEAEYAAMAARGAAVPQNGGADSGSHARPKRQRRANSGHHSGARKWRVPLASRRLTYPLRGTLSPYKERNSRGDWSIRSTVAGDRSGTASNQRRFKQEMTMSWICDQPRPPKP
jgi:hypothetical protein